MNGSSVLKFFDKFKFIFEKLNVDYDVMRKILEVKLTLDERRVPTIMNNKRNKDGKNFSKGLWMYILFGIILVPFIILEENYLYQMSIVFGILMFMMMTSLISDFSSVLLDIREKEIILTKPVDNRTFNVAKVIHILIYMFYITISFTGIALIVSLYKHGPLFFLIFLFSIILMDLFIISLTALIYFLVLKFFDGEKLKNVINYVQIILTIVLTIGYQFAGRLFNMVDLNIKFVPKWWQYIMPHIWFGAPFELILMRNGNLYVLVFSILAVVVPIISIILYVKLTPSFERNLQKLNEESKREVKESKLNQLCSKLICSSREERIFFRFATNMMKNERVFKLKVYPSLGFALIFPFIFIVNEIRYGSGSNIASGKGYLFIYLIAMIVPIIVTTLDYSGKYKGAWIYGVLPFNNMKPIFKATLKSAFINFILPIFIFQSIIFSIIYKGRIFIDLIIVFFGLLLHTIVSFKFTEKVLPFSKDFEAHEQSKNIGVVISSYIISGFTALLHYSFLDFNYGKYIYMVILIIVNIMAWKTSFNIKAEDLKG